MTRLFDPIRRDRFYDVDMLRDGVRVVEMYDVSGREIPAIVRDAGPGLMVKVFCENTGAEVWTSEAPKVSAFAAYWAGSLSASVEADHRAGNVRTVKAEG